MGLVYRGGRTYLYKSSRRDGRVTSEYVASGESAILISRMEAIDADERDFRRWLDGGLGRESEEVERGLDELCDWASALAAEALQAAGYHRHHRGGWRKRRVDRHREEDGMPGHG